jgi:tyrosyl-tRNA synthetase
MTTGHNSIFRPADEQLAALRRGAAEIIPEDEFRAKLEKSRAAGKPLRVYLGVDPTAPDLHLGHTVVLRKLKHFQDEGHTAIFLIGDFSAMIGDPTGQSETRPPLSREQVDANAKTYLEQVYKILDPQKTEVRYNSEWLGKMSSQEVVQLCGKYRLARMLEREDFRSRLAANQPISVHELLYPLLTAYDAVSLQADVELGATEQKFNLLVHREIQREYGQPPEAVLTMPILVGTDGERKMSKSLGNYIGISEPPSQMFGKIMSISDELMWSYYELVTNFSSPVIVRLKEEVRTGVLHPKKAKIQLAHSIVANFHGEGAAKRAADEFDLVFSKRQAPEEMPTIKVPVGEKKRIVQLILEAGAASTLTAAGRLIVQGGVELDGKPITFEREIVDTSVPSEKVLRAGKKTFVRVVVE